MKPAPDRSLQKRLNAAMVFLILSFGLFLIQLINLGTFNVSANGWDGLPISIRASSRADYGRDPNSLVVPPIDENILYEIIADSHGAGSVPERGAALGDILASLLPTPTTVYILMPTNTAVPLSATPLAIATSNATATPQPVIEPTSTIPTISPSETPPPKKTKTPRPRPERPTKKPK